MILPGGTGEQEVSIDYTYDALNRLISAEYSNGTAFGYTYDAAGNVLTYAETHYGQTTVTNFTYDAANQLLTAVEDETVWQYSYDGNGSLIQTNPGSEVANGSTRYTYNTAGYLTKVENFTTEWQTQSEMTYDGLGNRLEVTTYSDGESNATRYVLDGGTTLTEIGTESSTYYLYGRGVIGTLGESWNYILSDGAGSTRQLVDEEGAVTLSVSYTPWGDTMEIYGSGMLNLGYLGGVYDAGTGLIYMGNGQYYDPSTGQFLTRGAQQDQSNPYTPWNSDPAGMLIGPFGLIALLFAKKKKHTKPDAFIVVLILFALMGFGSSIAMPVQAASVADISSSIAPQSYVVQAESTTQNAVMPDNPVPVVKIDYSKADCGNAWDDLSEPIKRNILDFIGGYVYQFVIDMLGGPAMLGSLIAELSEPLYKGNLLYAAIEVLPTIIKGMPYVIDAGIESKLQSIDPSALEIYKGIKRDILNEYYSIRPDSLAFFIGQQFGRRLAWKIAKAEMIIGGFAFLSGITVDVVGGLINLGVTVGTGGVGELLALPLSVPVVGIATGVAVAGVAMAGGGALSIAYMAMNPVTPPTWHNILRGLGDKNLNYIKKRKWTWQMMQDVVNHPYTTRQAFNKANNLSPSTAYYNKAGDYVVVDNATGQLVQLSEFGNTQWFPDSSIVNPYFP